MYNVLQGGYTVSTSVWLRYLVPIRVDGDNSGGDANRFSKTNHEEAGVIEGGRDMDYFQGGSSAGSSGNPVGNDLHWNNIGEDVTVGGAAANIRGLRNGYVI